MASSSWQGRSMEGWLGRLVRGRDVFPRLVQSGAFPSPALELDAVTREQLPCQSSLACLSEPLNSGDWGRAPHPPADRSRPPIAAEIAITIRDAYLLAMF